MYIKFIDHFLNKIGQIGWREAVLYALDNSSREIKAQVLGQLNEAIVGWKFLLDIPNNHGSALVIGDELGIKGMNLSRSFKSVVILEQNVKRLIFFENATKQFEITNVLLVKGNLNCSLPFHDDTFSSIFITPIISYLSKSSQTFLISEVYRVMQQDGSLFLLSENKFSYLRVKCLLKGQENDYSKTFRSAKGYESLLKKWGFANITGYIVIPEYNMPREIKQFSGKKEIWNTSDSNWKSRVKYNRFLAPYFGFRALRSQDNNSFIENAISYIKDNRDIKDCGNPILEKYLLTPKGNCIVILSDKKSLGSGFVIKIPTTLLARKHDDFNYQALNEIHENKHVSQEVKSMIPKPIYLGRHNGQIFFAEERKFSKSFGSIDINANDVEFILERASYLITILHKETAFTSIFTETRFTNMIETKLEYLKKFIAPRFNITFQKIKAYLAEGLIGELIPLVRGHGDYSVVNIIVDGPSFNINGIIDWDLSKKAYLPLLDILNLIESKYNVFQGRELGSTVRDVFLADQLTNHSRSLIACYLRELGLSQYLMKYFVIVYWLHHVYSQLQYPFIEIDKDWIDMNIIHVLEYLGQAL